MSALSWPLAELTDEDRAALDRMSETRTVPAEQPLIRRGDRPQALFLLQQGTASVQIERPGRAAEVTRLTEGALLGEMSLVSGDPASATVLAVTPCIVAQVSAEALRAQGQLDPGFTTRLYRGLARVMGERLRRMNTLLTDQEEGFTVISWPETFESIRIIDLPGLVRHWIARYSAVGTRGIFLYKWCWRGVEETELTSVPEEWREHTRSTKLLAIILNNLLDDLASNPTDETRFRDALPLLTPHHLTEVSITERPDDLYLRIVRDLWLVLGERVRELPGWEHHQMLWDFDTRQVFNALEFVTLCRHYPGMNNIAENRAYLAHNVNLMPFAMIDLMASQADPAELGRVREAVHHAQAWGEIGNMLATWRREVGERDFTSRIFVLAQNQYVVTADELASLSPDELITRIEASGVERQLLSECRGHRDRMVDVANRCQSVDLSAYARGIETFFAMNLASRGYI
jgi:CRP-like cAMP-binding protein